MPAALTSVDGPTHRYIGASPACWDVYTRALAGDPPIGERRGAALVVDAYAAQHPGEASPQATQSVAVHLVVLHGVNLHGVSPADLIALRTDAVAVGRSQGGYPRLLPAPSEWELTIHDVVAAPAPDRPGIAGDYVDSVLAAWSIHHAEQISDWYRAAHRK
ncbi:MAG: DUF5946 family protein [Candidatus Limnocylindria bacterium]